MTRRRHIGKVASTEQKCVVAFMQIPNREDHALVIPISSLNPRFEQAVMDAVESNEGQNEETLANVLMRRIMPDTGNNILQTLHEHRILQAVPVSDVLMTPHPHEQFTLEEILIAMNRPIPINNNPKYAEAAQNKFSPHNTNQRADSIEKNTAIAKNLLIDAQMLADEARKKTEQAYEIAPHLKPQPLVQLETADYTMQGQVHAEEYVETNVKNVEEPKHKKASAKHKSAEDV